MLRGLSDDNDKLQQPNTVVQDPNPRFITMFGMPWGASENFLLPVGSEQFPEQR